MSLLTYFCSSLVKLKDNTNIQYHHLHMFNNQLASLEYCLYIAKVSLCKFYTN